MAVSKSFRIVSEAEFRDPHNASKGAFTTVPGEGYQQKGTHYVVGPCAHNSKEGMGNE